MLIGRYDQNIDAKGRVNIPSKFRADLGETFVVAIGKEKCVHVYPRNEWDKYVERINQQPPKIATMIMRHLSNTMMECSLDTQGRAVIPPKIREYAQLEKEIVVLGQNSKVEIWNLDNWNSYKEEAIDTEEIYDLLEGMGM